MAVTLSRAEIESLLGGLNLGSTNKPDARKDTLRQFGESLAEAIETELGQLLRGNCECRFAGSSTSAYTDLVRSIDLHCAGVIESKSSPHVLLTMNSQAVFPIIDCLLGGGSGEPVIPNRSLTDIELSLTERCFKAMAHSLESIWNRFHPIEFQIAHIESGLPAAHLFAPRESVTKLQIETTINAVSGRVSFLLADRLVNSLASSAESGHTTDSQPQLTSVSVRLKSFEVDAGTLNSLKPGDVLPLGPEVDPNVALVQIDENPVWIGKPGVNGPRRAVRIESALHAAEPEEDGNVDRVPLEVDQEEVSPKTDSA